VMYALLQLHMIPPLFSSRKPSLLEPHTRKKQPYTDAPNLQPSRSAFTSTWRHLRHHHARLTVTKYRFADSLQMGNILRLRAGRDTHSTIAHARTADAQHGVRTNHALPRDSLYPLPLPPAAEEACAVWNARSRAPPAAAHLRRLVRRSPTHAALSSPPRSRCQKGI